MSPLAGDVTKGLVDGTLGVPTPTTWCQHCTRALQCQNPTGMVVSSDKAGAVGVPPSKEGGVPHTQPQLPSLVSW